MCCDNGKKENPDKHFLVISPKQVIAKWKKVLAEAGVDMTNVTVKSTFNAEDVNKSFAVIYDEIHEIKTKVKHLQVILSKLTKKYLA